RLLPAAATRVVMDGIDILVLFGFFAWPLALAWLLTTCYIRVARDFRLIDRPSDRKFHKQPTPTGAGLVLYLVLAFLAFADRGSLWSPQFLFAGLIVSVGLLDDLWPFPAQIRLVIHGLITVPAVLLVMPSAAWEILAIGSCWVLLLIHAFNFI